ncbi:MAG TPA: response regulator [Burkholderiaceae bacterium]|jgi:DNA-binding NarL/FixJ family response regulator|nr:response regulator [Burkholderiaceae bacterium]
MALLRVYLVEDSPIIKDNLIDTLEELAPIEVVGAADTEEGASQWLRAYPQGWDLLIVDIFLKTGSGLTLLKLCQSRPPQRKVVVFSNYATPDVRRRCLELGADAVYDKSNEIDALLAFSSRMGSEHLTLPAAAADSAAGRLSE